MAKLHLLRSYTKLNDAPLGDFGLHIATEMAGNSHFPTPVVAPTDLTAAANNFHTAISVALDGTRADTANKKAARAALIALLDAEANYVELNGQNDAVIMTSSGFALARTSNSPKSVGATAILTVTNAGTTRLGLTFQIDVNAWLYEVEISSAPGVWVKGGNFTDPRAAVLTGLTPGTLYDIRARLMGQGNQTGEWCNTVSHMST